MTRRSAAPLLALLLVCEACGPTLMKLPSGPGVPAIDGRAIADEATAACRNVETISLEISVSGTVGGNRVRGRLVAGLTRLGMVRLEAVAPFGQPIFTLVLDDLLSNPKPGTTLLLSRDNRFLERGQFDAVLEAVTGISLDAHTLFTILTGCTPQVPLGERSLGTDWRVMSAGNDQVYLNREKDGPWRLVATVHPGDSGWRAEYGRFQSGLPRSIHLVSARNRGFDLQLALSQVEPNAQLGPEVFRVQVPASASPITLDELKSSGPLGANGR
jgi:hypothetical protein